jgi:hypothetical protein
LPESLSDFYHLKTLISPPHEFARLSAATELAEQRDLTDLERQGLIHAFEFTHELDDLLLPYQMDLSVFSELTHPALLDLNGRVGVTFYQPDPAARHTLPT